LLFKNIGERGWVVLVVYVTIIIFLMSSIKLNLAYVSDEGIVIFNSLFSRIKYKWQEFDTITFSTQARVSSVRAFKGLVHSSLDVACWYRFYSHEILVNSINTFSWTQTEKDEFNILIFDKADECGFSVKKTDVEIY
jgi:hypothetical protein